MTTSHSSMIEQNSMDSASAAAPRPIEADSLSTLAAFLLTVGLSAFAVAPLLYPGYIQTHAGFAPLWHLADLRTNFDLVAWTPTTVLSFDPLRSDGLLIYYLAAMLPLPATAAIKAATLAAWLMGGAGMFLWLKSWLGNAGALTAALVYVYLPHQLVTVYVRGAWGESLFWGLLPWAILAATYLVTFSGVQFRFLRLNRWGLLPISAFFWLGLGLSQLGLTVWALIFVTLLVLVVHRRQALLPILSALLGSGLAGVIYLLRSPFSPSAPLASSSSQFFDHFIYPFQLFSAYWGFGVSRPGWDDGHALQAGLAGLGLALASVFLWQRGQSSRPQPVSRTDRRLLFFGGAALLFILLQFQISALIWKLPLLATTLTYPWQLMGFVGLSLAILAGALPWLEPQFCRLPLLGSIVIVIILSVYSYLLPQFLQPSPAMIDAPQAKLGNGQLALLDHTFSVKSPGYTVGLARGETAIPLSVHGSLQGGDILAANILWQPLRPFQRDLKVFVHLVDSNDNIIAQFDGQPQQGSYPTSQWIPGELIEDSYPILFPDDAPPVPYRIFLGLYDEATQERLPVSADSNGRVILDVQ